MFQGWENFFCSRSNPLTQNSGTDFSTYHYYDWLGYSWFQINFPQGSFLELLEYESLNLYFSSRSDSLPQQNNHPCQPSSSLAVDQNTLHYPHHRIFSLLTLTLTSMPLAIHQLGILGITGISTAILASILLSLPMSLWIRTNSRNGNYGRPKPQTTNVPVVPRTSTTNSNQHRDDENFLFLLRLQLDIQCFLLGVVLYLVWSPPPNLAYWVVKSILHFVVDNIYTLLLLAFIASLIMCECILRSVENSLRKGQDTAAPRKDKAEQESLTKARKLREHRNQPGLRLYDLVAIPLVLITFLVCSRLPTHASGVGDYILRLVVDNINPLVLASISFWLLCERMARAQGNSRRNSKNSHRNLKSTAATVEEKAEVEFPLKARDLRGKASKNTAAPAENKAEQEFLTEARELREKVYQLVVAANASKDAAAPEHNNAEQEFRDKVKEVCEKVFRLAVASDARSKDNSTETALISPSVFAGVMDVLLCKDTDCWWETEPELAEYLQNVAENEDGWELVWE